MENNKELLLEIFSEEIPARLQKNALKDSKVLIEKLLHEYGAEFESVDSYVSVRRIAICINGLEQNTIDLFEQRRGPKVGAPEVAINGFLRSSGKTMDDISEKGGYYYVKISTPGTDIKNIIPSIVEDFINGFPWPVTMRWYLNNVKAQSAFWVRPIRSILCVYNGSTIDGFIKSVGIEMSNFTYGHRFLSKAGKINIFDFSDYKQKLEDNHVMLEYEKKASFIDLEMAKEAAKKGLIVKTDENLVYEVAGLVEYPFINIGTIDEKFMSIPAAVLSTSMKIHQKYLTLTYSDGTIAPFYGMVTNVPGTKVMMDGGDRVLRARLSDALFFFKEDTDISLDAFAQRLSNIVFHEKLGSVGQKVDRMLSVAETKEENRAVSLCKADLLTQMVGEFPELQGVMGAIYANVQDEDDIVAEAIREHYKPNGANDSMPSSNVGARLSFFDKLDTLVGFMGIGIYPTGSKDPFALRRAGFSIVRLICDEHLNVLCGEKLSYFVNAFIAAYSEQGIAIDIEASENIMNFINERLKVYMIDKLAIDSDFVEAIISSYEHYDFRYDEAISRAIELGEYSKHESFEIARNAYRRASGVVEGESIGAIGVSDLEFENEIMGDLLVVAKNVDSFEKLQDLSSMIIKACDEVMILDSDIAIKQKNVSLFVYIVNVMKKYLGTL